MLEKFVSRKLLVAVAGILTQILGDESLTPTQRYVIGGIAVAYILGQSVVDRATFETVVTSAQQGIETGKKVTEENK